MKNINQQVWGILSKMVSVQKDLQLGIINIRGLAKLLITKYKIDGSLDSVINSINRFESSIKVNDNIGSNALKDAKVYSRNNMCCIITRGNFDIKKLFTNALSEHCIISRTKNYVNIIFENEIYNQVIKCIEKSDIIHKKSNLCEIKLVMTEEALNTVGTLAKVVNELYALDINLEEMVVSVPEFLIYIKHKDFVKAHEKILEITS